MAAAEEARIRENDMALVAALDTDGNGQISLSEIMGLCKSTGIGKAEMRRKFREKDHGNANELNFHKVREILQELRSESKRKKEREDNVNRIATSMSFKSVRVCDA